MGAIKRKTLLNTLWMSWSKKEKDMMYRYPTSSRDGHLLHSFFSVDQVINGERHKSLVKELESRGYDLTTLRFSIRKKDETK